MAVKTSDLTNLLLFENEFACCEGARMQEHLHYDVLGVSCRRHGYKVCASVPRALYLVHSELCFLKEPTSGISFCSQRNCLMFGLWRRRGVKRLSTR
jgi:hypothetical protein